MTKKTALFDEWPEKYDQWFTTPIGSLVRKYESELILDLLKPVPGEMVLDAGCGTGVFTHDILSSESQVAGLDISFPMLRRAREKSGRYPFSPIVGDISKLPFQDGSFDKTLSITAIEFIEDAKGAVAELFRVTKKGGVVVVANLNSLSLWAARRMENAKKGDSIFRKAIFRSPDDLRSLSPMEGVVRTAIHFLKEDKPEKAIEIEREGRIKGWMTGAFAAVQWFKP
ncbi:MAG: methyltransferase domain-containing protein [Deltaproteobacteria bacterium]|nr:methyltransferase domain-containing protein [Deltaproteobacteria bacterium]